MPSAFSIEMAATAQELIDEFGGDCTLLVFSKPPVNTTTPWEPQAGPVATTSVAARMVFVPKTRENQPPAKYADGTESRAGDLNVYVGPEIALPPDVGGTIMRADGAKWVIKTMAPLDPSGDTLLYSGWIQR